MGDKKTMQMAKSNCSITCSKCGEQFNSKYGIMHVRITVKPNPKKEMPTAPYFDSRKGPIKFR